MIATHEEVNGMAVKLHRCALSKTQLRLAEEIGRGQMWISRLERGVPDVRVTPIDVLRLAVALGIQPADLER